MSYFGWGNIETRPTLYALKDFSVEAIGARTRGTLIVKANSRLVWKMRKMRWVAMRS